MLSLLREVVTGWLIVIVVCLVTILAVNEEVRRYSEFCMHALDICVL